MRRYRTARAMLVAASLVVACGKPQPENVAPVAGDSASPGLSAFKPITTQDLAGAGLLGVTVDVALQQLRPSYLFERSTARAASPTPIMVSVNGSRPTSVFALKSIPSSTVAEIHYLTPGQIAQQYRNMSDGPVILVTQLAR